MVELKRKKNQRYISVLYCVHNRRASYSTQTNTKRQIGNRKHKQTNSYRYRHARQNQVALTLVKNKEKKIKRAATEIDRTIGIHSSDIRRTTRVHK